MRLSHSSSHLLSRIFPNAERKITCEPDFSKRRAKNFLRAGFFQTQSEKFPTGRDFSKRRAKNFLRAGIFPNAERKFTCEPDFFRRSAKNNLRVGLFQAQCERTTWMNATPSGEWRFSSDQPRGRPAIAGPAPGYKIGTRSGFWPDSPP
jgi:hypothetical protein